MTKNKSGKSKGMTKSAIYQELAEKSGTTRKQVGAVFDEMIKLIHADVGKKGPGIFTLPGLLKIKRVSKPATKTRTIPNPFKPGEMMITKPKPAKNVVKAYAVKALKEAVQ